MNIARQQIETQRLILRKVDYSARSFFQNYLADPLHTLHLPRNRPYTADESACYYWRRLKHWRDHGFGTWLIELKRDDWQDSSRGSIGFCGLEYVAGTDCVDLRYGIERQHQGQAYAFEASRFILGEGFENLKLDTIYGAAESENIASLRILAKLGMERCDKVEFYGNIVKYFRIDKEKWDKLTLIA